MMSAEGGAPPSFLLLELFDDSFNETVEVAPLVLAHVYKFIVHHCIPFIIRLIRVLDHVPVDFVFSVCYFQKISFFHFHYLLRFINLSVFRVLPKAEQRLQSRLVQPGSSRVTRRSRTKRILLSFS